jgi:hypothetical protein
MFEDDGFSGFERAFAIVILAWSAVLVTVTAGIVAAVGHYVFKWW